MHFRFYGWKLTTAFLAIFKRTKLQAQAHNGRPEPDLIGTTRSCRNIPATAGWDRYNTGPDRH